MKSSSLKNLKLRFLQIIITYESITRLFKIQSNSFAEQAEHLEKQIREYQKIIEEQEARSSELARQERQMLLQIEEANERAENAENQMAKLRKRNKI